MPRRLFLCILLISLVASVSNTLFSNLVLLPKDDYTNLINEKTPNSKTSSPPMLSGDINSATRSRKLVEMKKKNLVMKKKNLVMKKKI